MVHTTKGLGVLGVVPNRTIYINWTKSIFNFPYRFSKPNSGIKSGFDVCIMLRMGLTFATGVYLYFLTLFGKINEMNYLAPLGHHD